MAKVRLKACLGLVAAAFVCSSIGCSVAVSNGSSKGAGVAQVKTLRAGGSSFIDPLMQQWIATYHKEKGVKINYQPQGSGFGVSKMIAKELDIGFSDAPMNAEQTAQAKEAGGAVLHIPMAMGGVVPAYNLPDVPKDKQVVFSGPVLADVFLGKIKKWNDKALQDLNGDLKLPDKDIQVVHRSDKSGTTFVFTDYLSKVSPEWKKNVGAGTSVKWKAGVGQEQNPGVAGFIARTPGAIGYVEVIYALGNKDIQFGPVTNRAGKPILASLESVTAAAAGLKDVPEDLTFSLTDTEGSDAYPIVGTVWAVFYEKQPPDRKQAVVDFLRWAIHEGQGKCKDLKYARLPETIVKRADQRLDKVHD